MSSPLSHRWLPLALIALAALWLRTHDLAQRPMHADEANQAVKLGQLLETGRYTFDPRDHHGPTLYYAAVPIAWLRGETTLATLSETTVRLVPAIAGTLSVLLLAIFAFSPRAAAAQFSSRNEPSFVDAPWTSSALGWCAAALLAVSPPAVYYSRYFVQETLLLTFALGAFVCVQHWWRRNHLGWALAAGVCVGLMQATKASAPLFLAAAAIAWFVAHRATTLPASRSLPPLKETAHRPANRTPRRIARDLGLALAAALLVAAAFYSSFGAHPAGLRDALATYTHSSERLAAGAGHEKPWWYYLHLFGWQRAGGLTFHQLSFTALALCGAALAIMPACRPRGSAECHIMYDTLPRATTARQSLLLSALGYTAIIAIALSATSYKTPWHAIHFVPGMALLAAGVVVTLASRSRLWAAADEEEHRIPDATRSVRSGKTQSRTLSPPIAPLAALLIFAAVLCSLYAQTKLAVFLRPADARNPYAYVHSSPDVLKFRPLADAALTRSPGGIVRVIGEEYWPLPWYFRGLSNVGYWDAPPDDCDAALVIASTTFADTVRERLHGCYRETFIGLRPGVLYVAFTPEP